MAWIVLRASSKTVSCTGAARRADMKFPKQRQTWAELDARMDEAKAQDVDWRQGRIGVYIHYAGDDVLDVAKRAYMKFFSETGLGPKAFPSLARFEREVLGM